MSPLDKKLWRDLWRMKGQAIAIGLVISVGVLLQVMMSGLVTSLDETRRAYYERYRLAEVFATVARAPEHLVNRLAAIPGVTAAESRVVGSALINLDDLNLPLQARAVSLPKGHDPRLNDILLTDGRKIDHSRGEEVLLLHSFAIAHGLRPGDSISATMNGARRTFRIVGLAQSPEFLYTPAPGEMVPDDSRFGVIWMSRPALAAAYDMQGAFNEALLMLSRNANLNSVLDAVDQILDPYGGLGAYGIEDQASNQFVTEEINGLRASAVGVPPIFLAVAAFLLYIVISRIVHSEREEIGLMKAFGYTNREVGIHYLKLVLIIAILGAVAGCFFGIAAGRAQVNLYVIYYKFPFLVFQLDPSSFVIGVLVSVLAASAGGLFVLRYVFSLTPADAMRPPTPPDYSKSGRIGTFLNPFLDQPSRMVLRRVFRNPGKMLGAVIGIASGMALSLSMISIMDGFTQTLDQAFTIVDRSDVTVSFTHGTSEKTIFELQRLPGILEVEPVRIVPVVMHNGLHSHRGAINGFVNEPRLNRALDSDEMPIQIRDDGIVVSKSLANILNISPGQQVEVEVREGRQPVLELPVIAISESLLGSPAYMEIGALNAALREPNRVSGAFLRVDALQSDEVYRMLKDMPAVAGVSIKAEARDALQEIMDSGAGSARYIMATIAAVITFGIVYNSARIAYAERTRDLASLRVIGFTKGEAAFVLLGELAIVTLAALPLGSILGHYLTYGVAAGFSTDLYQIPVHFLPASHGTAIAAVLLAAGVSGLLVRRDLNRSDLIAALKTRE